MLTRANAKKKKKERKKEERKKENKKSKAPVPGIEPGPRG
jgi:hypothetical protein